MDNYQGLAVILGFVACFLAVTFFILKQRQEQRELYDLLSLRMENYKKESDLRLQGNLTLIDRFHEIFLLEDVEIVERVMRLEGVDQEEIDSMLNDRRKNIEVLGKLLSTAPVNPEDLNWIDDLEKYADDLFNR